MVNLFAPSTLVRASSGLAQEARLVVDGSPETSWSSAGDAASELDPSSVEHTLWFTLRPVDADQDSEDEEDQVEDECDAEPVQLRRLQSLSLTFQGGYSAISATLSAKVAAGTGATAEADTWAQLAQVWPEDCNATQTFPLTIDDARRAATLRLTMHGSTDSFGRITLYGAALGAAP